MSRTVLGSLLACVLASSCSQPLGSDDGGGTAAASGSGASANGAGAGGGGSGDAGTSGSGGSSSNVGGSGGIVIGVGGTGSGGVGAAGNGMPEVCDGIDNNENGIIDDLDVGNDGVCDCLSIATIGDIGPWSNGGNIFATWLNERSPQGATALGDQVLTSELLAPFQVIVVLHVDTVAVQNDSNMAMAAAHHAFTDAEAAAFQGWLENGGGVMTTIGYAADEAAEVVNVNRLLATAGTGYSTTNLDLDGYVEQWEAHPVTMGVSNINTHNGVEPDGSGTVIARGQNDRVALQVSEAGMGRVVVWGDEWITYDSEWQDLEGQQVELFWLNILKWLSPPNTCQVPIPPEIE